MINITPQNNTHFKGIPVARIKPYNSGKEIFLYELTKKDIPFAKEMAEKLDLQALHPDLKDYNGFVSWKTVIKRAVDRIGSQPVFLAVQNKRPCGIIAYRNTDKDTSFLSAIATWPTKPNQPAEHAGKALMRKLFQYTHEQKNTSIELQPAQSSPRGKSCKDFYSKLGFKELQENTELTERWELKDTNFERKCAQLENFFEYKNISDGKEQDLNKVLTLKITDTITEKISRLFNK